MGNTQQLNGRTEKHAETTETLFATPLRDTFIQTSLHSGVESRVKENLFRYHSSRREHKHRPRQRAPDQRILVAEPTETAPPQTAPRSWRSLLRRECEPPGPYLRL